MKIALTTLINFNHYPQPVPKSVKSISDNRSGQTLIDLKPLLDHLAKVNHGSKTGLSKYHRGLLRATLSFRNLKFRHLYLHWIYSNYSKSTDNKLRLRKYEAGILVAWARRFNRQHRWLKIIKILPQVGDSVFQARLLMLGYSLRSDRLSFNFRRALEREFGLDYGLSFNLFERSEGKRMARVLNLSFKQYIPDADFEFVSRDLNSSELSKLRSTRRSPRSIVRRHRHTSRASQTYVQRLQASYRSVVSSAANASHGYSQARSSLSDQIASLAKYKALAGSLEKSSALNKNYNHNDKRFVSEVKSLWTSLSADEDSFTRAKASLVSRLSSVSISISSANSAATSKAASASASGKQVQRAAPSRSLKSRKRASSPRSKDLEVIGQGDHYSKRTSKSSDEQLKKAIPYLRINRDVKLQKNNSNRSHNFIIMMYITLIIILVIFLLLLRL